MDAIGNRFWTHGIGIREPGHPDVDPERQYTIASSGALSQVIRLNPPSGYSYEKNLDYDGAGNLDILNETEIQSGSGSYWNATRNFYDAGDRLRGFNRAVGPYANDDTRPGRRNVFEEYFYDALGRRVMVRSRRSSSCPSAQVECANYLERTVWDGDQVVLEIRAPAQTGATANDMENDAYSGSNGDRFGLAGYVHAGRIDQPIVVIRNGYGSGLVSVHPHQNWRGVYELGTKSDGTLLTYTSGTPKIEWPGARATLDGAIARPQDGAIWFGNLIPGKSDGSGLQYMRNRYYDASTGRFTQQDPIGLAGGMNLYGFVDGDPINFSDPFGLCCKELFKLANDIATVLLADKVGRGQQPSIQLGTAGPGQAPAIFGPSVEPAGPTSFELGVDADGNGLLKMNGSLKIALDGVPDLIITQLHVNLGTGLTVAKGHLNGLSAVSSVGIVGNAISEEVTAKASLLGFIKAEKRLEPRKDQQ